MRSRRMATSAGNAGGRVSTRSRRLPYARASGAKIAMTAAAQIATIGIEIGSITIRPPPVGAGGAGRRRQEKSNRGAAPDGAFRLDHSAMREHGLARDREAESCAAGLRRHVRIPDAREPVW